MLKIALMIVKNEQEMLPLSLPRICDVYDHVLVLDNGSTDGTVDILRTFHKVREIHFDNSPYSELLNNKLYQEADKYDFEYAIRLDADEFPDIRMKYWTPPKDIHYIKINSGYCVLTLNHCYRMCREMKRGYTKLVGVPHNTFHFHKYFPDTLDDQKEVICPFIIKHLHARSFEQLIDKYNFYEQVDPKHIYQQVGYEHIRKLAIAIKDNKLYELDHLYPDWI